MSGLNFVSTRTFGDKLRHLRETLGWPQKELAEKLGLSNVAYNQIEKDVAKPTWVNLKKIIAVFEESISVDAKQITELLFATLDRDLPEEIIFTKPLVDLVKDENVNLWIFANEMLEEVSREIYEKTVAALGQNYQRWYFMPRTAQGVAANGLELCKKLNAEKFIKKECLKLYAAPPVLCSLNLALHNPVINTTLGLISCDYMTIAEKNSMRRVLDDEYTNKFLKELHNSILPVLAIDAAIDFKPIEIN